MLFIFQEKTHGQNAEDVPLLEKLNFCCCFAKEAHADDRLPKYICMSCSILVENAYQLKVLCAKTEEKYQEFLEIRTRKTEETDIETDRAEIEANEPNELETNPLLEEQIMNMKIEFVDIGVAKKENDATKYIQQMTYMNLLIKHLNDVFLNSFLWKLQDRWVRPGKRWRHSKNWWSKFR